MTRIWYFTVSIIFLSVQKVNSIPSDDFCSIETGCRTTGITKAQTPKSCSTDKECEAYIENSKCVNQKCVCSEGLLSSDQTKCLNFIFSYGEACEDNVQCSERLTEGGKCLDGACTCTEGYHYLKGRCWKSSGLNDYCVVDEQCYAAYEYVGLKCESNACKCRDEYYERFNSYCRRKRSENEVCSLDDDCFCATGKGTCIKVGSDYTCNCGNTRSESKPTLDSLLKEAVKDVPSSDCNDYGYFTGKNGECVIELGMTCENDENCAGVTSATCLDKTCSCVSTKKVADKGGRKCQKSTLATDIGQSCTSEVSCAVFGPFSLCESKQCACVENSHWVAEEKYCRPSKKLGEVCVADSDCYVVSGDALCDSTSNTCKCKEGSHEDSSKTECRLDAKIDENCQENTDCFVENTVCNGTCQCALGYFKENESCTPGIGGPCKENACHVANSVCKDEKCDCASDFVDSGDKKTCLPVVNYQENCTSPNQCNETLGVLRGCIEGKCECQESAHYSGGKCYKDRGEKCLNRRECGTKDNYESVICQNGICKCQYGYTKNLENKCILGNSGNSVNKITTVTTYWSAIAILWAFKRF